jgi:LacI family transcriptional regulator, repressor for deo operon, udp, cdd, tsx, nupC, and nupG
MSKRRKSRPTLEDVARMAKVSYATVSYILNNNKHAARISGKTRDAILKAAGRLRYQPDPMGRALQRGYTNQVTLLITTWELAVAHAAEAMAISRAASARELDVSVQVADTHEDAADFLEKRMLHHSGGLLVLWDSPASKNARLQQLAAEGLPVVGLLPGAPSGISSVTPDREDAGRRATKHLIELGHRNIGVLADSIKHIKTRMRKLAGYRRALKEAGIRYDERLMEHAATSDFQGGYDAFQRLYRRCPDVAALFCLCDATALGAITAAADVGRRCPEDISVVGFGDAPAARYWRPSLTTFSLSCDAIAAHAIELLIDLRKNRRRKPERILIPEELIIRNSTGPAQRISAQARHSSSRNVRI